MFRAAGIVHEAFPRIVAQLGVKHPELNAEIGATSGKVDRLYGVRKYREAAAAAETLVALTRKRYGEERTEFAAALGRLALLYELQSLYREAEPLRERSLSIVERALGPEQPAVTTAP